MLFLRFCPPLVLAGKDSRAEPSPATLVALVPEEKVSFSLSAHSVSALTVAKIRKAYNKLDSKAVAKQVGCADVTRIHGFLFQRNLK